MRLASLVDVGRTPALPLLIELEGAGSIQLLSLLRVLPGQRYVGRAQWQGREVLAKLLVGDKAERHFARELRGVQLLAERGLKTPELLVHGSTPGEGGWLLFEFLDDASSLGDAWQALAHLAWPDDARLQVLGEALAAIAGLHRQGLWQEDLHLDNLLRHQGSLYLIDGGGVRAETPGQPLSRDRVLANLGVFFAQFPSALDPFIEELLVHYLLVNGEHALPLEALLKAVAKARGSRLHHFMGKLGRDCSAFCAWRGASRLQVVRREEEALLARLLADPDAAIAAGQSLKRGGSSTVARVDQGARQLVIKRYNIKGMLHWLKRFWRPSRAWHSWCEGNRLVFLGIATPKPLAVLECRTLWLRRRSYLVTEHASGVDIITRFASCAPGELPAEAELRALDDLFAALLRERISHGDLKGSNILWQDGRWMLIDLDAMQQHRRAGSFAPAYAKDRARFLRNWPQDSTLYQVLDERLPSVVAKPNS
ncbi:serine/threonine protein kinase [Pseudomonas sp. LMG 31766]|jgi:tRNA A-37 threonylcarbamoyl transferase component Bud32|uniref:Serine/threonine protein kinase n=1 Tax=Pseudomonas chaetocerotis TaxID=2758695 RepID=A0A931GIW5_9PSED|nr:lipopolysaccharide kinase InaA family protein [Pseudomonas chaetocerotis]MBZ9663651.1 serine/threonine protein kinase [Pseudomonas chaetocerotis]